MPTYLTFLHFAPPQTKLLNSGGLFTCPHSTILGWGIYKSFPTPSLNYVIQNPLTLSITGGVNPIDLPTSRLTPTKKNKEGVSNWGGKMKRKKSFGSLIISNNKNKQHKNIASQCLAFLSFFFFLFSFFFFFFFFF